MEGHLRLVAGNEHDARLTITDIAPHTSGHFCPEAVCRQRERNILAVTAGLAYPPQVSRGLLAGNAALLEHDHRYVALGQCQGGRQADNAGADDYHGRRRGELFCALHWLYYWWHA
ncbi:hypothetical protein D3C80_1714180 [compost metagenome]